MIYSGRDRSLGAQGQRVEASTGPTGMASFALDCNSQQLASGVEPQRTTKLGSRKERSVILCGRPFEQRIRQSSQTGGELGAVAVSTGYQGYPSVGSGDGPDNGHSP